MIASTLALIARRNAALKRYVARLKDARGDHHIKRAETYHDAAKQERIEAELLCAGADTFAPPRPKIQKPKAAKALPPPPVTPVAPRVVPPPPAFQAARFIYAVGRAPGGEHD